VDHPEPVDHLDAVGDLDGEPERLGDRELPLPHPVGERPAVGVRHDEVRAAVLQLADVVHPHQAFGVGATQDPGLFQETVAHVQIVDESPGQHLDGHGGIEQLVSGEPHGSECSGSENTIDSVTTDGRRYGHPRIMPNAGR
jgi:hypothetical protein